MKIIRFLSALFLLAASINAVAALKTGDAAPDFSLTSVDGKTVQLNDYQGKIIVLEWYNMGCPFVKNHYAKGDMQALQAEYTGKGIVWLTINSTNPKHTNYLTPEQAAKEMKDHNIRSTAMLQDPEGKTGKAYGAKTTPHLFIVDASGKLVYQGAIDDSPSTSTDPKKAKNHVRAALEELLAGKPVNASETKAYGCSIKYAN